MVASTLVRNKQMDEFNLGNLSLMVDSGNETATDFIYEYLERAQKCHCEPNPKVGKRMAWKQFPQPAVCFERQMNG